MSDPIADDATAFRPPEETPTVVVAAETAREELQLAPGAVVIGRYRIVSLVGKGGMGEVYRADDLKLGQPVALKFLAQRIVATHLYDEVRIGRQISHPNVCRLYDIAEVDGRPFITMEFVDGEDLASLLRRIGRLSHDKALSVTRDICAGLAAAHEKGVVHRDLKPGNVMIDGRGRARITDFGLAVLEQATHENISAGTPAYMAPEQLAGERATVRSDLYALGLILYEVFTGHRAFEAKSVTELIERQRTQRFAIPTSVVPEINAEVERAILHALDPDPAKRPASVEALVDELPRFDPLKAAIAAGETPTPGMIAADQERGDLRAVTAWSLLSLCVVMLLVYAALAPRTMMFGRLVLRSPDILMERANEILAVTKQSPVRRDSDFFYSADRNQMEWKGAPTRLAIEPLRCNFRQSPSAMAPARSFEARIMPNDPPLIVPGMADVTMDAAGRLMQVVVVPPRAEAGPRNGVPFDWTPFLRFAGVDGASLKPAVPLWSAPVDSDEKRAWTIGDDGTRIEAAAYHGKAVWFALLMPWDRTSDGDRLPQLIVNFSGGSMLTIIVLITVFVIAAVLLAVRSLRRGQGDRRGATRIAVFLFLTFFAGLLLRAHHSSEVLGEWLTLLRVTFFCASLSLVVWFGYVATEPLVRRRWPRMLISWSRLLAGRVRDPMIGRDLLIGMTLGVSFLLVWQLTAFFPNAAPLNAVGSSLAGIRHCGFFLSMAIAQAVVGSLMGVTILITLFIVTRSAVVSASVYAIICSVVLASDAAGPWWLGEAYGLILMAVVMVIWFRFGLLVITVTTVPMIFVRAVPITLDSSAWYFGRSLFALAVITAMALYGFVISLGGKRWLPEIKVE